MDLRMSFKSWRVKPRATCRPPQELDGHHEGPPFRTSAGNRKSGNPTNLWGFLHPNTERALLASRKENRGLAGSRY